MSVFIPLTHSRSGEKLYIRADQILVIRVKEGKTLVITTERGIYVNEDADMVRDTTDSILAIMYAGREL